MPNDTLTVELRLGAPSPEEVELFGLDLQSDLDLIPEVAVVPARSGSAPAGSKSATGFDWGQLLLTLAASGGVLTALIGIVQSRMNRERTATLIIGTDKLELSGLDPADQGLLIQAWLERHQSKRAAGG